MNFENLGGRNLEIDLANRVFEGKMDEILKKLGGGSPPPLSLRLLRSWECFKAKRIDPHDRFTPSGIPCEPLALSI